ncbi:MAG: DUF1573 domain-containing protein [Bacteroidota bacterium]
MKRLFLLFAAALLVNISMMQAQDEAKAVLTAAEETALVEWVAPTSHDFGAIPQGTPVKTVFKMKNLQSEPLLIDNVRTTCGCTAPDWTKDPVLPGATTEINVSYNAAKMGKFNKVVKVYLKGQKEPELLIIQGEVKSKEG